MDGELVTIDSKGKIVSKDELFSSKGKKRRVVIPARVFKVISYNPQSKVAEAEEILDKSLIKAIAVQFEYESDE